MSKFQNLAKLGKNISKSCYEGQTIIFNPLY